MVKGFGTAVASIVGYFKGFDFIIPSAPKAITLDETIAQVFVQELNIETTCLLWPYDIPSSRFDILVITEDSIRIAKLDYTKIWDLLNMTGHLVCLFQRGSPLHEMLRTQFEFLGYRFRSVICEYDNLILEDWQTIDRIKPTEPRLEQTIKIWPEIESDVKKINSCISSRIDQDSSEIIKTFSVIYSGLGGKPKKGVEIGCLYGGSTIILSTLMNSNGTLVSIDIDPANIAVARRNLDKWGKTIGRDIAEVKFVHGQSWNPNTIKRAMMINPSPWDFILIDGSHMFNSVIRDFISYMRGVRPGGYIVVHDIDGDYRTTGIDIRRAWDSIIRPCFEDIYEFHGGYGTGLVRIPND